jgi:SnoaL-like domain
MQDDAAQCDDNRRRLVGAAFLGLTVGAGASATTRDGAPAGSTSLPRDVLALQDIEAIKILKARYCRYLDGKQWEELRRLFAPECRFLWLDELADQHLGNALLDVDAFMKRLTEILPPSSRTVHHVYAPEIIITGSSTASGIWAMDDYVTAGPYNFHGYGHYEETYAKIGGDWSLTSWKLTRIRVDDLK